MSRRALLGIGAAGAAGGAATLALGAATGMPRSDLGALAIVLGVAALGTVGGVAIAGRALARASFRSRLIAVTAAGVGVSLVNLLAIALLMFVSPHDAALMAVVLAYAAVVGVAASIGLARSPSRAVARLDATARRLARGDLDSRVGPVDAGPELASLAATLDDMATRLQTALAREREAEGRRRDLITAVSHDLRTPLASVRAMVEAIEDGVVDDPADLRRYAIELRRAIATLSALVDDLFELSQLDAGAIAAETERARLGDVVASASAACAGQAREKGVDLVTALDGAGEAPCSPRLVRVVQNLIQNAVRHTPSDGTVRVEAARGPEGLEVVVTDTGEGIPADALERVFEPFWRGDEARSSGGSGLGLALAKRIVEALGGEITVASVPAEGSRFAIRLPA